MPFGYHPDGELGAIHDAEVALDIQRHEHQREKKGLKADNARLKQELADMKRKGEYPDHFTGFIPHSDEPATPVEDIGVTCQRQAAEIADLRAQLAAAEVHEEQTHEELGNILGFGHSIAHARAGRW